MTHHQITWKTNKTAAGFAWQVWSFGYGMPTETLKTGICPTRAKALGEAKRWCLWFKAKARRDEGGGSFVAWFGSYDPPTSRGDAALTSAVIMNVRVERDLS